MSDNGLYVKRKYVPIPPSRLGKGWVGIVLSLDVGESVELPTRTDVMVCTVGYLRRAGRIDGRKYVTRTISRDPPVTGVWRVE